MELQDYIRVVRKRWRIIAGATVLALLAAGVLAWLTPKEYQSRSQLFVSMSSATSTAELAAGRNFTASQVKTYADLVTTPSVLDPVIERLALPSTSAALADQIKATVPVDTVLIDIAVTNQRPADSQAIANEVARQLTTAVPDLETIEGSKSTPVKVTVVSPALPGEQVVPRPTRNLALGLVLGLLLGLGVALLRDRLDTSIKNEGDVKEVTDQTVIGGVFFDEDAAVNPLIIQADIGGRMAEAFRSVRTNLQFIDVSNPPRTLAVTSSLPGEGKSTTAANLALTIAAGGASVCVVEGDLRRARLLEYMGLEGAVGLTNVLIGELELDDVLQPFADTNVTVLGAGPTPPNPSELLGSAGMRGLIDELRDRFDYVIIDTPPLLPVTDAAVISKMVDGAIMVVGAGLVAREHLARSIGILDTVDARLLGLIINRLPTERKDRYTYHGGYYGDGAESSAVGARDRWVLRREEKQDLGARATEGAAV
ncbi:MAG: polysaccharide biosynthesis tyrosine autokinase [Dermatophilaceae bacterium]